MKSLSLCCVLVLFAGCATKPPPVAACRGEFRPVNGGAHRAALPTDAAARLALCPARTDGGRHG